MAEDLRPEIAARFRPPLEGEVGSFCCRHRIVQHHVSTPVASTGVHCTWSMWVAPVASITSRSRPSATPLAGGIARERGQKILVDRIALAVDALLLVHLGGEAAALLAGVGQFGEAVGELDAAGIELEALGDRGSSGLTRASAASDTGYSVSSVDPAKPEIAVRPSPTGRG